jgi:hypothetical protein
MSETTLTYQVFVAPAVAGPTFTRRPGTVRSAAAGYSLPVFVGSPVRPSEVSFRWGCSGVSSRAGPACG